jgi:hypothetical protein
MMRTETRAKWLALVSEQSSSGKSAAAWCRDRQVDYASLLRWKRILVDPPGEPSCGFVELVGVEHISSGRFPLALDFGHGLRLELPSGFDAVDLRRTVSVLREAWR